MVHYRRRQNLHSCFIFQGFKTMSPVVNLIVTMCAAADSPAKILSSWPPPKQKGEVIKSYKQLYMLIAPVDQSRAKHFFCLLFTFETNEICFVSTEMEIARHWRAPTKCCRHCILPVKSGTLFGWWCDCSETRAYGVLPYDILIITGKNKLVLFYFMVTFIPFPVKTADLCCLR